MAPSRGCRRFPQPNCSWCMGLVALSAASVAKSSAPSCVKRSCLPPDSTQSPPICYTKTVSVKGVITESFATCPENAPHCDFCEGELPCESRCGSESVANRAPGSACDKDEQCMGQFGRCLQRVCRNALHTFQECAVDDRNDVCVFGRRSCFRGRCQGLQPGDLCSWQPEGKDIDCNPGWYCYLGACSPQLPAGHTCVGLHPNECVRGYRCNLAEDSPSCVRQYSLVVGHVSNDESLCRTGHVDPKQSTCAAVPEIEYFAGRPVVNGIDCEDDSQCLRKDGSFGKCLCKSWWSGEGSRSYCELSRTDVSDPSFLQLWEVGSRLCHQDWHPERCATEIGLKYALQHVNLLDLERQSDPTDVAECALEMLSTDFLDLGGAHIWNLNFARFTAALLALVASTATALV